MSRRKMLSETTSSTLIKPTKKLNWLPELLPPSPTWVRSLLSVPNNMDKELFINLGSTLDVQLVHLQDGFQELWQINLLKNSNNPDSWLLLILNQIVRPSLKHLMSIFQLLLFVTPMLLLILLILLSHVETEKPNLFQWSFGCWPEKFWF